MPTAAEVYRDYETDGVPASGPHDPLKSEIRALLTAIEGAVLSAPRAPITIAGTYVVDDLDSAIFVNLGAGVGGTVNLSFGAVAARAGLPLLVIDWGGGATINCNPDGTEKIMGVATWPMVSGGAAGLGARAKFIPNTDLAGWGVED